jgi:2-C-methyl-D-erythritol 4-phosphate cytidylyltransferase
MNYGVVIAAAGSGSRMGLGYNKVYYPVQNRPLLAYTIDVFEKDDDCKEIIVVTSIETFKEKMSLENFKKVKVVEGGSSRQESIYHGLLNITQEIVMIHDGARPHVTSQLLNRIKETMKKERACCLMVPCKDTIKVVSNGYIEKTIPRETLMAAQTPQTFYTKDILACMQKAIDDAYTGTDDASLVEKYMDIKVSVVLGDYNNLKITTPEDLKEI